MATKDTVTIHGHEWDRAYVKDQVGWCRGRKWERQRWTHRPVKHESPRISPHDHCMICQWVFFDSPNTDENTGYWDGKNTWICRECYDRFVAPEKPDL